MAVRIRVYPQNGLGAGALGMNRMGAVSAQTYYNQKLQSQQQVSNLRLQYERALFDQKLDNVRLEERLKNPYAMMGAGMVMNPMMGYGAMNSQFLYNPMNSMLGGMGGIGNQVLGSLGLGRFF